VAAFSKEVWMSDVHYDASRTGLLLVDPYNDFLSDGGKLSERALTKKCILEERSARSHLGDRHARSE
jgi:hypothetical protein